VLSYWKHTTKDSDRLSFIARLLVLPVKIFAWILICWILCVLISLLLIQSPSNVPTLPPISVRTTLETDWIGEHFNGKYQLMDPIVIHRRINSEFSDMRRVIERRLQAIQERVAIVFKNNHYWQTITESTNLFTLRLCLLVAIAPVMMLWISLALVDGLVQRNVRKCCGGRESATTYHTSKRLFKPAIAWISMVYLCIPVSVNPYWVYSGFLLVLPVLLYLLTSRFKKYL